VGAVLYGLTYQKVHDAVTSVANYGNVVIPDLWNLNPYLTVFLFVLMSVFLFYLIDRAGLHRTEK
jgi:hypothetical protein